VGRGRGAAAALAVAPIAIPRSRSARATARARSVRERHDPSTRRQDRSRVTEIAAEPPSSDAELRSRPPSSDADHRARLRYRKRARYRLREIGLGAGELSDECVSTRRRASGCQDWVLPSGDQARGAGDRSSGGGDRPGEAGDLSARSGDRRILRRICGETDSFTISRLAPRQRRSNFTGAGTGHEI